MLSHVWLLATPWTVTRLGSSVHGISQERIPEGVAISSSGDLPSPGVKPVSPALAGGFFTTEPPGKPVRTFCSFQENNRSGFPSQEKQPWEEADSLDWNPPAPQWDKMKHWVPETDQLPQAFVDLLGLSCLPDFTKWMSALTLVLLPLIFLPGNNQQWSQTSHTEKASAELKPLFSNTHSSKTALCLRSQLLYPWGPYEQTHPGSSHLCLFPVLPPFYNY